MKYQATHTLTRNNKVVITKGQVLTEKQVITKKVKNYVIPFVSERNKYTQEELDTITRLYLTHENRNTVVSQFLVTHGNTHTEDSVNTMVSQCETLDNTRPNQTQLVTSQGLRRTLQQLNPTRFG